MENILYILGAGFSAPLGIPVMKNFIEKSKDMYSLVGSSHHYFESIYKRIDELHKIKSYINSDLFNIEEILSILEMGFYVGENNKDLNNYKNFLKSVIAYYTPDCNIETIKENIYKKNYSGWHNLIFQKYDKYGYFICTLFNIILNRIYYPNNYNSINYKYEFEQENNKEISYSIITLNYDLVIENIVFFLNNLNSKFNKNNSEINIKSNLAKLHGSIEIDIVLPTWNKSSLSNNSIENVDIKKTWKKAYEMIKNSNQIRIIGYSLPTSDNYMKYLLSIGIKNSQNLKNIDVITVDSKDSETERRYKNILLYHKLRFKNSRVEDYLNFLFNNVKSSSSNSDEKVNLNNIIENTGNGHNNFMEQ